MKKILETSRAQKAIQAIRGKNKRVRTIAIVSAENPMGKPSSSEYNKEATQRLLHDLSEGNIIYFPTKGVYGELPENSVFIYNVSLNSAKYFADTYNQQSMIFVDMTSPDQISYQYWERPAEGKQLKMTKEEHDIVDVTDQSDNYTKICRRFKFRIPFIFEGYIRTLTALNECPSQSDVDRMLTETTTSGWSGWHTYVTRGKLYGKWYRQRGENYDPYQLSETTRKVFAEELEKEQLIQTITENVMEKIRNEAITIPHYRGNFLKELRGVDTFNTAPLVSINETNAKRLLDRHTQDGYIAITPCRGFADFNLDGSKPSDVQKLAHINSLRVRDCLEQIKDSGFSYTPAYGGSVENQGTSQEEEVFQCTFLVYPYDKQGNLRPFEELKQLGISLAKQYNQDDVLVVAPNEPPTYYKKDGSKGDVLGTNVAFNDLSQRYFTDLHKNTAKTGLKGKPTRFSYVECYINPAPQCLSEAHTRYLSGEVCLRYM